MYLQEMVQMLCSVVRLDKLAMNTEGKEIWKEAEEGFNSALPVVYISEENAKLDCVVHSMVHGMADPLISLDSMQSAP